MTDLFFRKTQKWITRNARPLDYARWLFHFEKGSIDSVLKAMAAYQNPDGGFGHALEPDAWNPNSTPIQTWAATEILYEIGLTDQNHPLIQGILQYLDRGADFNGRFWYNVVKSNNDYPHAPWWHTESESTSHHDYNPTACLAGFALKYAGLKSRLYETAARVVMEAYDAYMKGDLLQDMNTAACYIRMAEYIDSSGITSLINLSALQCKLKQQVSHSITINTDEWKTGYICKTSQFFNSRESIYYADNRDIAEYECEFIIQTQLEDGTWNIPWGWKSYPEEWAISKNWWKANGAILNMRYLKGFGKIHP